MSILSSPPPSHPYSHEPQRPSNVDSGISIKDTHLLPSHQSNHTSGGEEGETELQVPPIETDSASDIAASGEDTGFSTATTTAVHNMGFIPGGGIGGPVGFTSSMRSMAPTYTPAMNGGLAIGMGGLGGMLSPPPHSNGAGGVGYHISQSQNNMNGMILGNPMINGTGVPGQPGSVPVLPMNGLMGMGVVGMQGIRSPMLQAHSPQVRIQSHVQGGQNAEQEGRSPVGGGVMRLNGNGGAGPSTSRGGLFNGISALPPGGMDPAQMTGNYGPAAAAAAAAAAGNTTGRTVYVGNLPADASVDELMNLVRFGPVESVRLLPEKSCVFISFLDGATAAAFHADATVKKLTLHGQELKIGWGKPSVVPPQIVQAIGQAKATRNVYLGGLDDNLSESALRDDLSRFGPIDQVKIVRDKSIGFVHFLSIQAAMKVVTALPQEPAWHGKRVGYGKDRCAYVPRAQQAAVAAAQQQAAAALGHTLGIPGSPFQAFAPHSTASLYGFQQPPQQFTNSNFSAGFNSPMHEGVDPLSINNRCVYLGQLAEEVTTEEICNAVRGGQLLQIKYIQEKHIAFVTFASVAAAQSFFKLAMMHGLTIAGKRAKIGWGKMTGKFNPALLVAVDNGASRNVYIGGITDFDKYNEQKLKGDFEQFGDIEQINFLKDKKAAFVNFCGVLNATKAIEALKPTDDYTGLRLSFGKDRCAQPPRPNHFNVANRSGRRSEVTSPSAIDAIVNPLAGLAIGAEPQDGAISPSAQVDEQPEIQA